MTDAQIILAAIDDLRAEVRALRIELAMRERNSKTPRQVRYERRCARLRQVAEATGLGQTYAAAGRVLAVLAGKQAAPIGCERDVELLRSDAECPKSLRAIWRVIQAADE